MFTYLFYLYLRSVPPDSSVLWLLNFLCGVPQGSVLDLLQVFVYILSDFQTDDV